MIDTRMIAPTVFGILVVLFGAAYASIFLILPIPLVFKVLVAAAITGAGGTMVYVILQRKRELIEEDKDDLSKY